MPIVDSRLACEGGERFWAIRGRIYWRTGSDSELRVTVTAGVIRAGHVESARIGENSKMGGGLPFDPTSSKKLHKKVTQSPVTRKP